MHRAAGMRVVRFGGGGDPLVAFERRRPTKQVQYLRCYLHDLGAQTWVIEPHYFDRDYLSEFVAFYATSTAGYPNVCQRLHAFSRRFDRRLLTRAVRGDVAAQAALQESYLGHIVQRPLPDAPIGRTVLRTYPDAGVIAGTPRVMKAARSYDAHVAGITWRVHGLAWQQQDSAVGACATVALWSVLHASAFDDHHAIPTTADITRASVSADRAFPAADGMYIEQMLAVVQTLGLAPVRIVADQPNGFSREFFSTIVSAYLRSGYPVLAYCTVDDQPRSAHAVCLVGFRNHPLPHVVPGELRQADGDVAYVYLHDDNLGPNARFAVVDHADADGVPIVRLEVAAPPPSHGPLPTTNPSEAYDPLLPTELLVAVQPELRTTPGALQDAAITAGSWLPSAIDSAVTSQGSTSRNGLLVSSRFIRLVDYVDQELAAVLGARPGALAAARLAIWERVPPMGMHVGLVRVSDGTVPLMDVLFDTSDSDRHLRPRAYVAFQKQVPWLVRYWEEISGQSVELGVQVDAW